jgi:uncharacterized protein (TIGR02246 family)
MGIESQEDQMNDVETPTTPADLMTIFATRMGNGDVEGLLALYEPDAVFEPEHGVVLRGLDEIRPALSALAELRPRLDLDGEPAVISIGDVALVSNQWTLTAATPDGSTLRQHGVSADVLRRQVDGSWRVLIDQPRGSTLVP